jgi:hypothetical protein
MATMPICEMGSTLAPLNGNTSSENTELYLGCLFFVLYNYNTMADRNIYLASG